jgi:hypothetical protein
VLKLAIAKGALTKIQVPAAIAKNRRLDFQLGRPASIAGNMIPGMNLVRTEMDNVKELRSYFPCK